MIKQVSRDEIHPLRWSVLRPGLPPETAQYPEDDRPGVFHLAVVDDAGAVISCVTFFPDQTPSPVRAADDPGSTWRFRGMATAAEHRNRGIGGELLEAGVTEVGQRGGELVWCNGRSAAADFYRRHGFSSRGAEFDLSPAGPHYVFVRVLPSA